MPVDEISSASSQKLCTQTGYIAVSDENRELMYKELERRGGTCTTQYIPPPTQVRRPANTTTTTNCNKVGDNVTCTTR